MRKKWIAVLKFGKLSVPEKITTTRDVADAIDESTYFPAPGPDPTTAALRDKTTELEHAASDASTGDHEAVALMHKLEIDLEIMVTDEVNYVSKIANKDFENAEVIIKSAGMDAKKVPVQEARQFKVENTDMPGQVKAVTKGVTRASFIWQYSTDQINWTTAGTTIKAQIIISGLTSGTKYFFRVAVVDKNGQGPFSNPFSLRIL